MGKSSGWLASCCIINSLMLWASVVVWNVEFIVRHNNGSVFVMYVTKHYYCNAKWNVSTVHLNRKWENWKSVYCSGIPDCGSVMNVKRNVTFTKFWFMYFMVTHSSTMWQSLRYVEASQYSTDWYTSGIELTCKWGHRIMPNAKWLLHPMLHQPDKGYSKLQIFQGM